MLDDLQAVLTNLGIVHSRISKWNATMGKSYDEVYATGEHAEQLCMLVPFLEPDKAERASRLLGRPVRRHNTADVVPGLASRSARAAPRREAGSWLEGRIRSDFNFLLDPRTTHVSRRTLERVAAAPASRCRRGSR